MINPRDTVTNTEMKHKSVQWTPNQIGNQQLNVTNDYSLQVVAKSKVGSLDNAKYRPGGGDKKIETRKLDFQGKSKVGSTANMKHVAGGGHVKVIMLTTGSLIRNADLKISKP